MYGFHTFVLLSMLNAIQQDIPYDDKLVIGINYREQTTTITFKDLEKAQEKSNLSGSGLDCSGAPYRVFITDFSCEHSIFSFSIKSYIRFHEQICVSALFLFYLPNVMQKHF